ncbi:MAG: universal stress protein [Mucilaginibacter sp.]
MKLHRILIAIDDTPSAEMIALNGLQLANQFHAAIGLVSIINPLLPVNYDDATPKEIEDMIDNYNHASQQRVINRVFKDVPVRCFIEMGKPGEAINKIAEEWQADMIVMGTHGRKGFSHFIMGSVAEEVMRHCKKTLVVIPIPPQI